MTTSRGGGTHWPLLDLVRSLAALMVLFGHARWLYFESIAKVENPGLLTRAFYFVTGMQHEGVVLFFVVSGFLVGGAAWAAFAADRFSLRHYLVNRFVRIYLVFIPALLLTGALALVGAGVLPETRAVAQVPAQSWDARFVACHIACLQGVFCSVWSINPPLWSLSYEWLLYLMAPMGLAVMYASGPLVARCIAFLLVAAFLYALLPESFQWFWVGYWALGAGAAWIAARGGVPAAVGWIGLGTLLAALVLARTRALPVPATDIAIAAGLAAAISCQTLLLLCPAPRLFAFLASFSYSLYAIHYPVVVTVAGGLERLGGQGELLQPGLVAYSSFAVTLLLALLFAATFARLTEAHTDTVRRSVWPR